MIQEDTYDSKHWQASNSINWEKHGENDKIYLNKLSSFYHTKVKEIDLLQKSRKR